MSRFSTRPWARFVRAILVGVPLCALTASIVPVVAPAAAVSTGAVPAAPIPEGEDSERLPACVTYEMEARYAGAGYNHLVHITNTCEAQAICNVTTNVNPAVLRAVVPVDTTVSVLTYRGSPAREFMARVVCELPT